jgi:hypothetical protein
MKLASVVLLGASLLLSPSSAFAPTSPLFPSQAKIASAVGAGHISKKEESKLTTALQAAAAGRKGRSSDAPPLRRNPPRKVCLMVEPTPFTHVSGYANRFKEMLKFLAKAGDKVDILTVDSKTPAKDLPKEAYGFPVRHTQGFTFPLYNQISLSCDLPEMKGAQIVENFRPDLIHVTSP